jgi:hypothetical protein
MSETAPEGLPGDYSYDLVHEEVGGAQAGASPDLAAETVQVTTESSADEGGDYSYDLAHDIPPAGQ